MEADMDKAIRRTDCQAPGTISDELLRLSGLGYNHAAHIDVAQLQPKEFFIHFPDNPQGNTACASVFYREK